MHDVFLLAAAACYLLAAGLLYRNLLGREVKVSRAPAVIAAAGVVLHAAAQAQHWFLHTPVQLSFLNVMSLCALVVVVLLLLAAVTPNRLFAAGLIALPMAGVLLLAEWAIPAPGNILQNASPAIGLHVVSSVMAFSFLGLAAIYAVFLAISDHFLRRHHLNRFVRALPALDVLESLLFTLISLGFILLTVSLVSGLLFISDMFAQHLAHKTILSISAWVVFGVLLWGRRFRGWRGRTAVRFTLGGVVILTLAYFGSKFVLEWLLHESWS